MKGGKRLSNYFTEVPEPSKRLDHVLQCFRCFIANIQKNFTGSHRIVLLRWCLRKSIRQVPLPGVM
ncbi:MAG: hypothetical protein HC799_15290 [Limnothrix sp. RL_2_0]|nr:hypothetical protein [Limnothrix sp. RL_2_0]